MKRVIVKNLSGVITNCGEMEDPSEWIKECVENNYWGKKERWVYASEASEDEKSLALAEGADDMGTPMLKLPATYSIEILDITQEHALFECLRKRRAEYPSPEDFLNAWFDGGDAALEELKQKRLAVKAKHPKPAGV